MANLGNYDGWKTDAPSTDTEPECPHGLRLDRICDACRNDESLAETEPEEVEGDGRD